MTFILPIQYCSGPSTRFTVTIDDTNSRHGRDITRSADTIFVSFPLALACVQLFSRRHSSKTIPISILKANYNRTLWKDTWIGWIGPLTTVNGRRENTDKHLFAHTRSTTLCVRALLSEPQSSLFSTQLIPLTHPYQSTFLPFNFKAQRFCDGIRDFGC